MEQLAIRHSNCFFCDNFQESTQDSFIYPVILHNIISSVRCSDFMDMLQRLIDYRIIIIIIIIIKQLVLWFCCMLCCSLMVFWRADSDQYFSL